MKARQIAPIVALALVVPASAQAADNAAGTAPPGSSAVDQYRESAPPAGSNAGKLTKKQRERLAAQGEDGRELSDALERNGGVPAATPAQDAAGTAGTTGASDTDGDPSSADAGAAGSEDDSASSGSTTSTGAAAPVDGGGSDGTGGDAVRSGDDTLARSSASSTVGPFPVWGLVVAAFAVVGVAAVVRHRAA